MVECRGAALHMLRPRATSRRIAFVTSAMPACRRILATVAGNSSTLTEWRHVMSIDSYRFLDFASRQIMKAWAGREKPESIPFTALAKPLRDCTIALLSTAGIARNGDVPFDQERERRDPWWGDPTFRVIPLGTTERDVRLYHLHIDPRFGQADLDVVLPMRRLTELAQQGVVGRPAPRHYSTMGYILDPAVLVEETAPKLVEQMRADDVDAAALVPA
jgi:D-proline reductase (dithiol) PrdB